MTQLNNEKITLGDVIRLALPLKTAVLAGAKHARRNVEWSVLLTSWNNLEAQVRTGDLVILPPELQQQSTNVGLRQKLEALANMRVAGVLSLHTISADLVKLADENELPFIVAPEGTSLRDVHQMIASLLIDRQAATSQRTMQLYRQLSEMSREGQGLEAMTDVMSNLTGKIVVVQDKRLMVVALKIPNQTDIDLDLLNDAISQRDALPAVLRNRKAAAKARQSHWQQLLPIEGYGRLISPIISGDRARGYLSVLGPLDELDLLDSLTVEHGAAACALEMAKAKAVSEAKKALRGNFLEGLLAGKLPQAEIDRLEGRLDHNTQRPHAVMVFSWLGDEAHSIRRLETTLNWLLNTHNRAALVHIYGGQHVVVFQALKTGTNVDSAMEFGHRFIEQIEAEFSDSKIIGGLSGPIQSLGDWPKAYKEALQAMNLGRRLKLNNQVVEYSGLGVYHLLCELESIPAVQTFTDEVIGPLVDYDKQGRGSLVQTISAYFDHHGNISQTAETLFVHRNTLLYRLERIQELTGHDLNQGDMRLALHLALKFWQLRSGN